MYVWVQTISISLLKCRNRTRRMHRHFCYECAAMLVGNIATTHRWWKQLSNCLGMGAWAPQTYDNRGHISHFWKTSFYSNKSRTGIPLRNLDRIDPIHVASFCFCANSRKPLQVRKDSIPHHTIPPYHAIPYGMVVWYGMV